LLLLGQFADSAQAVVRIVISVPTGEKHSIGKMPQIGQLRPAGGHDEYRASSIFVTSRNGNL
jgi:hypothetical protein